MPITAIASIPADVADLPVFTVDLGFSEEDTSVGLASTDGSVPKDHLQFAAAIRLISSHLTALSDSGCPRAILLIEAPLSTSVTPLGNPCHRQIELQRNYERGCGPRSPKGWYYQAGANLSLGSVLFLRGLDVPRGLDLLLIEGFYCSLGPDEKHADHHQVAVELLNELLALPGQPLVTPRAEVDDGVVRILPGLESIVSGIPGVLLRPGLKLTAQP